MTTTVEVIVPELGQVVRCRDRVWAVNDVARSTLPVDPIAGSRPQHLVRMTSLEDDGFGDELFLELMRTKEAVERGVPRHRGFERLGLARQVHVEGSRLPGRLRLRARGQEQTPGREEKPPSFRQYAGSLPDNDPE